MSAPPPFRSKFICALQSVTVGHTHQLVNFSQGCLTKLLYIFCSNKKLLRPNDKIENMTSQITITVYILPVPLQILVTSLVILTGEEIVSHMKST